MVSMASSVFIGFHLYAHKKKGLLKSHSRNVLAEETTYCDRIVFHLGIFVTWAPSWLVI